MIIQRYIFKEVFWTFLGVTFLLLVIFLSGTFVRILAEAADGDLPVKLIFHLFMLKAVANLVLILPLSLFLAVLLALGRLYTDSEMVAMTACGVTPGMSLRAISGLALILALLVGYLTLIVGPAAEERSHQLLDEAEAQSDIEGVMPGRFNIMGEGGLMVYVGESEPDKRRIGEILAQSSDEEGRLQLLTASEARQKDDPQSGARFLILKEGHRYEGQPGEGDFSVIRFREHGIRIQTQEVAPSKRRRNAIPSSTLYASDDSSDIAELQWRLSIPISLFILALLAVPLSRTSPRQGRYGKFFLGIFAYIVYNNMLTAARSVLGRGEVPPEIGLWWVHLLALAVAVLLLVTQYRIKAPKSPVRQEAVA